MAAEARRENVARAIIFGAAWAVLATLGYDATNSPLVAAAVAAMLRGH